jgi:hypothetical protein
MKKISLSIFVAIMIIAQVSAQEPTFSKGDKVLNLGVGFGTALYVGTYYKMQVPPVSASFEYGIKDGILEKGSVGVGGYLGFASYKWEYSGWGWKYSNIIIAARGTFHYPLVEKLDTYVGVLLGYDIVSSKEFGTPVGYDYSATSSGLAYSGFIGGRYYFKEKFGVMAELGYGITYLNIGVALKL